MITITLTPAILLLVAIGLVLISAVCWLVFIVEFEDIVAKVGIAGLVTNLLALGVMYLVISYIGRMG